MTKFVIFRRYNKIKKGKNMLDKIFNLIFADNRVDVKTVIRKSADSKLKDYLESNNTVYVDENFFVNRELQISRLVNAKNLQEI